ncbi:hypothetical protein BU16DRAFT_529533, partial [Lophium mytilinum]
MLNTNLPRGSYSPSPSRSTPPNQSSSRAHPLPSTARSLKRFLKSNEPQTFSPAQLPLHQPCCGHKRVVPVAEHGFHIARHAFEHDGGDGDEGAVFGRGGEDAVLLCEEERGGERSRLGAGSGADDNINLKKRIQHKNMLRVQIALHKRRNLHNLR